MAGESFGRCRSNVPIGEQPPLEDAITFLVGVSKATRSRPCFDHTFDSQSGHGVKTPVLCHDSGICATHLGFHLLKRILVFRQAQFVRARDGSGGLGKRWAKNQPKKTGETCSGISSLDLILGAPMCVCVCVCEMFFGSSKNTM